MQETQYERQTRRKKGLDHTARGQLTALLESQDSYLRNPHLSLISPILRSTSSTKQYVAKQFSRHLYRCNKLREVHLLATARAA